MEQPKRRFEVAIKIGADNIDEICHALREIEFMYASRKKERLGAGDTVSGGYGNGWICADRENPNQTHDQYFIEVDAWIAERKAVKEATNG